MPLYELNRMHSHRHPFVGDEDEDYEELIGDSDWQNLEEAADQIYLNGDVDAYFGKDEPKAVEKSVQPPKTPSVPTPDGKPIVSAKDLGFDIMTILSPTIAAVTTTGVAYSVARAVNVTPKKAFKVAAILGGFAGISQVFGNWLKDKIEDLQKLQQEETKKQGV
jgi:hypothetical protein